MTLEEISKHVGVTRNTVSRWKNDGEWETLKGAQQLTATKVVNNLYLQALELSQNAIGNADKIAKIAAAIDKLKPNKISLSHYINVMDEILRYIQREDVELAKKTALIHKQFINHKIKDKI